MDNCKEAKGQYNNSKKQDQQERNKKRQEKTQCLIREIQQCGQFMMH